LRPSYLPAHDSTPSSDELDLDIAKKQPITSPHQQRLSIRSRIHSEPLRRYVPLLPWTPATSPALLDEIPRARAETFWEPPRSVRPINMEAFARGIDLPCPLTLKIRCGTICCTGTSNLRNVDNELPTAPGTTVDGVERLPQFSPPKFQLAAAFSDQG